MKSLKAGRAPAEPLVEAASIPETHLSAKSRKRLLEIETRRKWREFEEDYKGRLRAGEEKVRSAERRRKECQLEYDLTVEEIGGMTFSELPPTLQKRKQHSHRALETCKDNLMDAKLDLDILKQEMVDKKERLHDEMEDEKERIDILADINDEQRIDSEDEEKVKRWDDVNSTASVVNEDVLERRKPPQREKWKSTPPRCDGEPTDSASDSEARNPVSEQSHIGVSELVAALGSAFGNSSNQRKLPPFSGCPAEWLTFLSAYDALKDSRKVDRGDMIRRLGEALRGDAKQAVQHLLSNPLNLGKVMEVLERRFGKPEFVLTYLVQKAKACKSPEMKNPKTIIEFGTSVEALVENIMAYKKKDYLKDKTLQQQLLEKLPEPLQYRWFDYICSNDIFDSNLMEFSSWLNSQVRIAECRVMPTFTEPVCEDSEQRPRQREPRNRQGGLHAASSDDEKRNCAYCDKPKHSIPSCFAFKKLSVPERKNIAKDKRLCYLCLKPGHMTRKCDEKERCKVNKCGKRHHTLLHEEEHTGESQQKENAEDINEEVSPSAPPEEKVLGAAASANILPIIPVRVKGPAGTQKVYALLDSGATFSMIEASVAAKLGLTGSKEELQFTVFGDKRRETSWNVGLEVAGDLKNSQFYPIKSVHTVKKLGLPGRTFDADSFKMKYPHARKMNAPSMRNARPQMVIGINAGGLFAAREILEVKPGQTPAAIRSLLGWYVAHDEDTLEKQFHFLCECRKKEEEMHNLMKDFFSVEAFGVQPTNPEGRSKDDIRALDLLDKATVRLTDEKRWSSCLLWKSDDMSLPPSKQMAMKRLESMERKMDKDPEFAALCRERFQDYQEKRYLLPRKDNGKKPRRWYLPWFFALHPTKKPRLVFDGAAKVQGRSLNDYLMTGPDLFRPLPAVLLRFRRHVIGLTADIKEMFHQVDLVEEDRASQTVLYRGMDRKLPPKEYEMSVLFFGSASSPCSAIFAKDRNAEEFAQKYPEEAMSTKKDMYMDDLLSGGDDTLGVIRARENLTAIHDEGGFLLTKWNSSSVEVMASIPPELRAESFVKLSDKSGVRMEKTLGIYWDPVRDAFGFKVSLSKVPEDVKTLARLPTKREMASVIMSLFDPLGFVMPLKIKALCLMQDVWRNGTDWDEVINKDFEEKWNSWMNKIRIVEEIRIPRKLSPVALKNCIGIELHCFVDASQDAFAAVVYLRINTGGSVVTPFIMGKARVAPLRQISIPRMELQAAVMGARMTKFIINAFDNEIKIDRQVYWSDSKTVLAWLRSSNGRFNTFVSNRVGEISELTNVSEWRWIPTKLNVADDATRADSDVDLSSRSRWLTAPDFLRLEKSEWPEEVTKEKEAHDQEDSSEDEGPVVAIVSIGTASVDAFGDGFSIDEECGLNADGVKIKNYLKLNFPDPMKYSNWFKLVRATAQCLRGIRLLSRKKGSKCLTLDDIRMAKDILIARVQKEMFPDERECLLSGKEVNKKSKLYALNPALDDKGIIIHRGRLLKAKLDVAVKCPPILDPKHHYTRIMISSFHEAGGHWGQERIMNELRLQVWIIDSRTAVKRASAKCLLCEIRRAVPRPPQMGLLPEARLDVGKPPFYHTGVDYFGPYEVKLQRSTVKRYGVLFTCMTTRAVHLELSQSLDTNDFLNVLARFISIRGKPAHLWSDNGKNFVGAEREMKESIRRLKDDGIQHLTISKEIEWHFIVPLSPHMGGSWERLIGSVKRILSSLVVEHHPKEDTLRTMLYEVMGIMNSRPITYASVDPDDDLCLTPNLLLNVPCVIGPAVPGDFDSGDRLRKSWRHCQLLAEEFWRRFSSEYLPWLSRREKWLRKVEPLKVGDIVLILEDNAPRNSWKKGRIEEIHLAKDGQARSALVRVASVDPTDKRKEVVVKFFRRPVVKLCKVGLVPDGAGAGRENVLDDKE